MLLQCFPGARPDKLGNVWARSLVRLEKNGYKFGYVTLLHRTPYG